MNEAARTPRWPTVAGALLATAAIALSAYAAHGAAAETRGNLYVAAGIAFGHGLALAALVRPGLRRLGVAARAAWLAGTLLFGGSLVGAHFLGTATTLAPLGGSLTMLGWLLLAIDALRR